MNDKETRWAVELSKVKHNSRHRASVPIAVLRKHIEEEMAYWKTALKKNKETAEVIQIVRKLLALRAKQTALVISETKETYGDLGVAMIKDIATRHLRDCEKLINAFTRIKS